MGERQDRRKRRTIIGRKRNGSDGQYTLLYIIVELKKKKLRGVLSPRKNSPSILQTADPKELLPPRIVQVAPDGPEELYELRQRHLHGPLDR